MHILSNFYISLSFGNKNSVICFCVSSKTSYKIFTLQSDKSPLYLSPKKILLIFYIAIIPIIIGISIITNIDAVVIYYK